MSLPIVERDRELADVTAAIRDAVGGAGCVVIVSGEAGIGKSRMVEAAAGLLPAGGRLLLGYCDDLSTSRPLGPLRDLARGAGGLAASLQTGRVGDRLAEALRAGGDRGEVLDAFYAELDCPGSVTLLAVEDVHWADDATLDALGFLVRRIDRLPAVLLLTYRADELTRQHPLRLLLGQVSRAGRVRRLPLSRLSSEAVRRLAADAGVDTDGLFALTSGNPFCVSEILAARPGEGLPTSVVHAVLGKMTHLDQSTHDSVEQLSVLPSTIERWMVDLLVPGGVAALASAEQHGLIDVAPQRVSFRHELTRRAIADSLPAARRMQLNQRVLAMLTGRDDSDVSHIVHHAAQAGDVDMIVHYGPTAGREAARASAHRQAAAHFHLVLEYRERFDPAVQAELLTQYATECLTIAESAEAVRAQREAVELLRSVGDPCRLGAAILALSRAHWRNGDHFESGRATAEAVEILSTAGDARLLAAALAQQAARHMTGDRNAECVRVGEAAIALAHQVGDKIILPEAQASVGVSRWLLGDSGGRRALEESLHMAESAGAVSTSLGIYGNLIWELIDHFQLDDAARYLGDAMALAERTEHLNFRTYLRLKQGRLQLFRGDWDAAVQAAGEALHGPPPDHCRALMLLGQVQTRRGDPAGEQNLTEAWEIAVGLGKLMHLAPAATARAEAAWLRHDPQGVLAAIDPIYDDICRKGVFPVQAELAYWLTRAGRPEPPMLADNPYGLLVAGRWREAAQFWQAARCPYERAMALAESPEPADRLEALAELTRLGADPLARTVRRELRKSGVTRIPRGPSAATRDNPVGLTGRQLQVLVMLSQGRTNAEIAERLVTSIRTIDSHVAAVLGKLGASNRRQAISQAAELGLFTPRPL